MKKNRGITLLIFDVVLLIFSYTAAIIIRYDFKYRTALSHEGFIKTLPIIAMVFLASFLITKTNRSLWDRISIEEGLRIVLANALGSFFLLIIISFSSKREVPFSVIVIAFLLNTLIQEVTRFSYRLIRLRSLNDKKRKLENSKRVLIYGAGEAGTLVARELISNPIYNSYLVGFIDDNSNIKGKYISGHTVFGGMQVLEKVITQHVIDEIILAMPSQPQSLQNEIAQKIYALGVPLKKVTSSEVLFSDSNLDVTLKNVDILDLLQRKEIVIKDKGVKESLENKNVLVTGAGGSIGSELVRQIIKNNPTSLTLIDINENGLYDLQQELKNLNKLNVPIKFYIASIRDCRRVDQIFEEGNFDLVFHAAAHKHVPLMEDAPGEAIMNNIFGTFNLIESSKKHNVDKFVNISTDKAVNPTNVMGATKRFNEMMLQSQPNSKTKFLAVRFGNVLGSNGSVVPLFKKQIEKGGPVTVTHPDITRYFMTIPEAVSLVLQAETYASGGEIFVLDMGDPVKILDLAKQMITLSGFTPFKDIDIKFSGLRPGEKLYEELLMDEEGILKTDNDLIHIAKPMSISNDVLLDHLNVLKRTINNNASSQEIIKALKGAVPTFMDPKECNV